MTILDDAVNVLAGNSDDTSSALRKLLVVGTRMESVPITEWCQKELTGYAEDLYDDYPTYRRRLGTPVIVRWTGYGGSIYDHPLQRSLVPEVLGSMFTHSYSEPIDELEASVDGLQKYWPLPVVQHLRGLAEERKVPIVEDCQIYSVWQLLTPAQVKGVIGAIRNRALMMALELQKAFPEAGEPGGPTVRDQNVRDAVTNIYNTYINGGTNTVAMGDNSTQNINRSLNQQDAGS